MLLASGGLFVGARLWSEAQAQGVDASSQDSAHQDLAHQDSAHHGERRAPPRRKGVATRPPADQAETPHKASSSAASAPAASPPGSAAPSKRFAVQLQKAGVRTCLPEVEQLAAGSMEGVASAGMASTWFAKSPDARAVAVSIGQSHRQGGPIPASATEIFATPVAGERCDGFAVQVIPSPLSCLTLQQSILAKGRALDNLAGVPLLQNASGQVMLIPTAANTCVLIGLKYVYSQ